jgi:DNA-binding response OmpR family regulator
MTPKKVILVVCADEQLLSQRAFLLETRGYRVVKAESAERAQAALRQMTVNTVDLVLIHAPLENALTLLRAAKILHPFTHTLVTSDFAGYDGNLLTHADVYLPKGCWAAAELLERIKILVARKRGPHKKPVASVGVSAVSRRGAA